MRPQKIDKQPSKIELKCHEINTLPNTKNTQFVMLKDILLKQMY